MNASDLSAILEKHQLYLQNKPSGERANLRGANLRGAKGIFALGPIGSRAATLYAVQFPTCIMVKAGCFWGTLAKFRAAVKKTHGANKHAKHYAAACVLIGKMLNPRGKTGAGVRGEK